MPISTGQVYVSVGYSTTSNAAQLYELDSSGRVVASFPVRLLANPTGRQGSYEQPVAKGVDSGYAYYDGWFYSASGPIGAISSDTSQLAATNASSFYLYTASASPLSNGVCQLGGNTLVVHSYTAGSIYPDGVVSNWVDYVYSGFCNAYPQQLLSGAQQAGPSWPSSPTPTTGCRSTNHTPD